MNYRRFGNQVVVRLDLGDEVISALSDVQSKEKIRLAYVTGIGAVDKATIGTFDISKQEYFKQTLTGDMEIVNLAGNISEMDGKPYLHLHIVLAGLDGKAFGGHLNEAIVSGTGEIVLTCIDGVVDRKRDDKVGLNTFYFGE